MTSYTYSWFLNLIHILQVKLPGVMVLLWNQVSITSFIYYTINANKSQQPNLITPVSSALVLYQYIANIIGKIKSHKWCALYPSLIFYHKWVGLGTYLFRQLPHGWKNIVELHKKMRQKRTDILKAELIQHILLFPFRCLLLRQKINWDSKWNGCQVLT